MRWSEALRNGAQSSGAILAAMHQGAENSALKKTPPLRRATLRMSDNASIGRCLVWSFRHFFWRRDHSPSGPPEIHPADRHGSSVTMTQPDGDRHERYRSTG